MIVSSNYIRSETNNEMIVQNTNTNTDTDTDTDTDTNTNTNNNPNFLGQKYEFHFSSNSFVAGIGFEYLKQYFVMLASNYTYQYEHY